MTCDAPASSQPRAFCRVHAAADVEAAGKRGECGAGFGFVAGAEHNDVAAGQLVAPVKFGKPGGGFLGDKIRAQAGVAKRAADDLLHFAFVQINAGTKHGVRLDSGGQTSKTKDETKKTAPVSRSGF